MGIIRATITLVNASDTMLYRFILVSVLTAFAAVLSAQDVPQDDQPLGGYLPGRNPFSGETQTRLGTFQKGEIPDTLQFQHPRLIFSSRGRFNHWVGADPNLPTARFRPYTPHPMLMPSDYLGENVEKRPSANNRQLAQTPPKPVSPERTTPQPTAPNFYEQPGILDAVPNPAPEEPMLPGEKRWFRDLNGLDDRSAASGKKQTLFSGDAVSSGSELLQQTPENGQVGAAQDGRAGGTQDRRAPSGAQRNSGEPAMIRRYEQKLETMLAGNPAVQFLSPIRVSYQNGTVTVQGVVPNQTQKVAAGNALLRDPAVKQVNNLLTVLPDDPSQAIPLIEPKQ